MSPSNENGAELCSMIVHHAILYNNYLSKVNENGDSANFSAIITKTFFRENYNSEKYLDT